jgi:ribokinase
VRDTTATGDTFNAALAENQTMERALQFANAAAAISVARMGAQPSAPTRAKVDRLVA